MKINSKFKATKSLESKKASHILESSTFSESSLDSKNLAKAPLPSLENLSIAIIGLGYVGLPLALEFAKKYRVLGFDINPMRINELKEGKDSTKEQDTPTLLAAIQSQNLTFSDNPNELKEANIYIICVPTPIDKHKVPNLTPLLSASSLVGEYLKYGDIVIYESTTYPTCTENECKNALESSSKLTYNRDFYLGYSPERINPSDKSHHLSDICKITSGSTESVAYFVDSLYRSIITAGTHLAPSIKVAEMSKVIENAQRDLNIAFMNEVHIICDYLGIESSEVLEAAKTKWNFLPFSPGLVGGHCISVDPYYLTHKMNAIGYHAQVISSGRLINDAMPSFIAQKILKLLVREGIEILNAQILILGIAFKPNCPDVRNSKVPELCTLLEEFGMKVSIYDPIAHITSHTTQHILPLDSEISESRQPHQAHSHLPVIESIEGKTFDGIFLATAHDEFLPLLTTALGKPKHIFYTLTQHKLKPLG